MAQDNPRSARIGRQPILLLAGLFGLSSVAADAADTESYSYDALGRLIVTTVSAGPAAGVRRLLDYDPAGNRSVQVITGGTPVGGGKTVTLPLQGYSVLALAAPANAGRPTRPADLIAFGVAGPGTVQEGQDAVFTITKSDPSDVDLMVDFATANGSAAAPGDYAAASGRLTFRRWETRKTVAVPILADQVSEGAETLSLALSAPSGGSSLATASAGATIAANSVNGPPVANGDTLSLGVCTVAEKNVAANDTDPEGNLPLTLVGVEGPGAIGTPMVRDGSTISFTASGATGSKAFQYTIRDSLGATATGLLNVTVTSGTGCQ